MNKTVNINLAGIFFHIDEDAYQKLQHYLDSIKRSFTDAQGRQEIISDIEARIAELFMERVESHRQVVTIKEVEEVIAIMGQPEDYLVDETLFEDEPHTTVGTEGTAIKKLYRDGEHSYIAGVAAGLGHYLGVDAIWIRLIWILLALGSVGTIVVIYLLFWILVPEAVTTAQKLTMTGKPVNIDNIEKKVKAGYDSVSNAVKQLDLTEKSERLRKGSKSFFDAVGNFILLLLKIVGKMVGILLIIISTSVLLSLLIFCCTVVFADGLFLEGMDFIHATIMTTIPLWLWSLLLFLSIGIPFFFMFYLGLKILIHNLRSIGSVAKFSLFGLWLISVVGLTVLGVRQASEYAEYAVVQESASLPFKSKDTLYIKLDNNHLLTQQHRSSSQWRPVYTQENEPLIYLTNLKIHLKTTNDSVASVLMSKHARGNTQHNARNRAAQISIPYRVENNQLILTPFMTSEWAQKYRDQEADLTLLLPKGIYFQVDHHLEKFLYPYKNLEDNINRTQREIVDQTINIEGLSNHLLNFDDQEVKCLDCKEQELESIPNEQKTDSL